jgi:hypothetical protein
MRLTIVAIVIMSWPVVASAQTSALAPLPPLPAIGLPLPEITSPLTPLGLGPPPSGFPLQVDADKRRGNPRSRGSQRHRARFDFQRGVHSQSAVVYFLSGYDWGLPESSRMAQPGLIVPDPSSARAQETLSPGTLRLDLQPAGGAVQVYVDGLFVGTPDDIDGELTLPAGTHNIELRAAGYATLGFGVEIAAGRSITYRGALQRVDATPASDPAPAPASPPTAQPAEPSTFYFIPGCYMGNVPPDAVVLPANCDRSKMITRGAQR